MSAETLDAAADALPPPHLLQEPDSLAAAGPLGGKAATAVGLTALADYLFFGHVPGWSLGLFGASVLAALAVVNRPLLATRRGWLLIALNVGLCAALVLHTSMMAAMLLAVGIAAFAIAGNERVVRNAATFAYAVARLALGAPATLTRDARCAGRAARASDAPARVGRILSSWLVPVAIGAIFLWLFAIANPVIRTTLAGLDWWPAVSLPPASRSAFWLVAFALIWQLMRAHLWIDANSAPATATATSELDGLRSWLMERGVIIRSLVVLNAVFALENGLDVHYLWNGAALPDGMTFAEYAHQGAYSLMAASLLSAAISLAFLGSRQSRSRAVLLLFAAWIAQNVFMVASAVDRTLLYIDVYALSHLRLAALVWMGLVGLGLVLIAVRFALDKSRMWLINANAVACLSVVYLGSFVNIGALIANYNVDHCCRMTRAGQAASLDLDYLWSLGEDAIPALRRFADASVGSSPAAADPKVLAGRLADELVREVRVKLEDWRAWTVWRSKVVGLAPSQETAPAP